MSKATQRALSKAVRAAGNDKAKIAKAVADAKAANPNDTELSALADRFEAAGSGTEATDICDEIDNA